VFNWCTSWKTWCVAMEGLENVSVPGFYPYEFGDTMLWWSLRRSADM
jgi:hypothetical protein